MHENAFELAQSALSGRKLLVVGGDPRQEALRRLKNAFDLADVIHCPTRKNDASSRSFKSRLQEPGVALVVWALGLSRTHHGTELHRLCRSFEIPWVDCFRIPHPNLLASRIANLHLLDALQRRSSQLGAMRAPFRRQVGGAP